MIDRIHLGNSSPIPSKEAALKRVEELLTQVDHLEANNTLLHLSKVPVSYKQVAHGLSLSTLAMLALAGYLLYVRVRNYTHNDRIAELVKTRLEEVEAGYERRIRNQRIRHQRERLHSVYQEVQAPRVSIPMLEWRPERLG